MHQSQVIAITLIFYQFLLISIGLWASRRIKNNIDFLLGGRQLGAWVAGLSYAASTSSAWVLLGFSGFVFKYGYSALWMMPGIWGGYVVMWLMLGPRVREESSKKKWVTPTDFICANLKDSEKKRIASLAALLIAFCFIFYIAAQFDAAANAFISNFNMTPGTSLLLGATIILIYCVLGGFWAASLTDTMQAIVMIFAAITVSAVTVIKAGGYETIVNSLSLIDKDYTDWSGGYSGFLLLGFLAGVIGIGSGTFGQPHLLARLMAVKGEKELRMGFTIAIIWVIIIFCAMALLGLSAKSILGDINSGEEIFYLMAEDLLPPILAGIVIASILSAVMSTVDSLLLASSSAISHDLGLSRIFKLNRLTISRIVMTMIVCSSTILAWMIPDSIFNRVLFAWSALGAAFGAIVVSRVFNYEPTYKARLWSIIIGFSSTVLFYTFGNIPPEETKNQIYGILSILGNLPGDPFERLIPFLLSCFVILFLFKKRRA
ncbi:MAG TPA: sodium/proline symporter [Woeseiaceae bacterium]|nr:sodium/proline symporter [Woeseiaceae bacterium]